MHGDGEHFGNRVPFVICFDTATFLEHEHFLVMRHTRDAYDERVEAMARAIPKAWPYLGKKAWSFDNLDKGSKENVRDEARAALAALGIRRPRAVKGGVARK